MIATIADSTIDAEARLFELVERYDGSASPDQIQQWRRLHQYIQRRGLNARLESDTFVAAVIAYEVAMDDYHQALYAESASGRRLNVARTALQAQVDAGVAFWIAADAYGLVDLFTTTDPEATEATMRRLAASVRESRSLDNDD